VGRADVDPVWDRQQGQAASLSAPERRACQKTPEYKPKKTISAEVRFQDGLGCITENLHPDAGSELTAVPSRRNPEVYPHEEFADCPGAGCRPPVRRFGCRRPVLQLR